MAIVERLLACPPTQRDGSGSSIHLLIHSQFAQPQFLFLIPSQLSVHRDGQDWSFDHTDRGLFVCYLRHAHHFPPWRQLVVPAVPPSHRPHHETSDQPKGMQNINMNIDKHRGQTRMNKNGTIFFGRANRIKVFTDYKHHHRRRRR